jgi:hypothetical protein
LCVCTDETHAHGARQCLAQSSVADHDPYERKDLIALGVLDPDALIYLKGKCSSCHNKKTAATMPAGWNRPTED